MIKIVLIFLVSVSVFGQSESITAEKNPIEEAPLAPKSLVGYKFWDGGFMSTSLTKRTQFHYGIVHTYVENYKVLEVPLIIKKSLSTNFNAFFGARINSTINTDSSMDQLSKNSGPTLGASFELGLQYEVNTNFMIEMRYSVPQQKNSIIYPSQMDYNNKSMFRLGSEFRF